MPYIDQTQRDLLNPIIDELVDMIVSMKLDDETINVEGCLNYSVTKILHRVYGNSQSTRYSELNNAVGLLECIKLEYYRKVAAPYENQREFENGEIDA